MTLGAEEDPAGHDETDLALIESARHEFVRFGFRRANVEAIGRRAGVSRPTVYRRFPSKAALLQAVVLDEVSRFAERFDATLFAPGRAQDRLADTFVLSVRELRENSLLASVVESEPDLLLTAFTFDGADEFLFIRALLAQRIARFQALAGIDAPDAETTADLVLRLCYTVLLLPYGIFASDDESELRRLAITYLAPMLGVR